MYFQDEYLRLNVSVPLGETWRVDLPDTGILTSLLIRFYGRMASGNPTASSEAWRLIDFITNISVIANGATVVKSLTGKQAQYLALMDQRVVSPHKWLEYSQPYVREHVLLNFGRSLHDTLLGLDLSKFDAVELQITNNASDTYLQSITVSVLAHWLRDAPGSPIGYMRSELWRTWTTVASETVYSELPTELPIRRVILQAIPAVDSTTRRENTSMSNLMSDIEFALRSGLLRVYKGPFLDMVFMNAFDLGVYPITGGWVYHTADRGFDVGIGYVDAMAIAAGSMDGAGASTIPTITGDNNARTQAPETYEGDVLIGFLAKGVGYHNCGHLRFDYDPNPASWLDPMLNKAVLLNVTTSSSSAAADGTNNIVLDRLVRF